jgi:hypothetical protein
MAYPEWEMYDEKEEDRLEHVQIMKAKGKGPPKKNRTKVGMYNRFSVGVRFVWYVSLMVRDLQRRRRRVGRRGSKRSVPGCVQYCERVEDDEEHCISGLEAYAGICGDRKIPCMGTGWHTMYKATRIEQSTQRIVTPTIEH